MRHFRQTERKRHACTERHRKEEADLINRRCVYNEYRCWCKQVAEALQCRHVAGETELLIIMHINIDD